MEELAGLSADARKVALDRFWLLRPHLEESQSLQSVALARRTRDDRGERRAVSQKIKDAIEGLALQKPPLPVAALYRQVRRLSQDLGEPAPSYSVVYDIVSKPPADLVTLAHQGSKAYGDAFELVHRREADGPNAIWQADHTPLDILLVRPDSEPAKPWLTAIVDDFSRALAGYFLSSP